LLFVAFFILAMTCHKYLSFLAYVIMGKWRKLNDDLLQLLLQMTIPSSVPSDDTHKS